MQSVAEDVDEHYYVRNVDTNSLHDKWEETIKINGVPMKFDCGADIMVISVEYYNRLLKDIQYNIENQTENYLTRQNNFCC